MYGFVSHLGEGQKTSKSHAQLSKLSITSNNNIAPVSHSTVYRPQIFLPSGPSLVVDVFAGSSSSSSSGAMRNVTVVVLVGIMTGAVFCQENVGRGAVGAGAPTGAVVCCQEKVGRGVAATGMGALVGRSAGGSVGRAVGRGPHGQGPQPQS